MYPDVCDCILKHSADSEFSFAGVMREDCTFMREEVHFSVFGMGVIATLVFPQ